MNNEDVEEKIDRLEEALMQMAYEHSKTERALRRLSWEMQDFKQEMKVFKDEMKDFKNEMKAFKDDAQDFKDEMKEFKNEMRASKKENDRRWSDLAKKLGTDEKRILHLYRLSELARERALGDNPGRAL